MADHTANRLDYEALPPGTIRLLVLQPGSTSTKISFSIRNTIIADPEDYDGLSYTWGLVEPPFYLDNDGRQIRVTKNLHDALHRMRLPDKSRVVWVDALCINQADEKEKSIQVAMMREIYSKVQRLFIWLGEPPNQGEDKLAADAMSRMSTILKKYADPLHLRIGNKTSHNETYKEWRRLAEPEILTTITPSHREALAHVFECPWFSRVWIVQEAIAAPG